MKRRLAVAMAAMFAAAPSVLPAQGLDPQSLMKPSTDSWPTYAGDYSQRRFSSLKQINQGNIKNLALQWMTSLPTGQTSGGGFGVEPIPTIVGGVAEKTISVAPPRVGGAVLQVNGILYVSAPDNAWAVDARDGTVLWHFFWKTRGGTHIGNRGMAMYKNYLFFETPDDFLVSLDARTGKERWHKEIADFAQEYFSTPAPILIRNHLLVGTGDDLDSPGFLQSFDPETGDLQWKYYTVPMKEGDPGLETWKNLDAARHGGAQVWVPGSFDPETNLYIFPTGNPTPAYTNSTRGEGDNLFTGSIIALDVDTGKMKWYFQTAPHDTHDWDSTQAPVLMDGVFNGKPRKMVIQAARNGYFFVLDRVTGEHLLTSRFSNTANWSKGIDERGRPMRDPAKDMTIAGTLVSPDNGGATNWPPPSYSPDTGLFYLPTREVFAMYYQTETDERQVAGLGGKDEVTVGSFGGSIQAIDYKTGKTVWQHRFPSGGASISGLLTTAGGLLFGSDSAGNFVAYDPLKGDPIWHARLGNISNAPETYQLDGRQYVLVATGATIVAFALNP